MILNSRRHIMKRIMFNSLPRRFFAAPPDGEDRNDYKAKSHAPFGYDHHGTDWDKTRWPVIATGQEQSPIALYRGNFKEVPGFKNVTFNDIEH